MLASPMYVFLFNLVSTQQRLAFFAPGFASENPVEIHELVAIDKVCTRTGSLDMFPTTPVAAGCKLGQIQHV